MSCDIYENFKYAIKEEGGMYTNLKWRQQTQRRICHKGRYLLCRLAKKVGLNNFLLSKVGNLSYIFILKVTSR
jgi:hypothetical protein